MSATEGASGDSASDVSASSELDGTLDAIFEKLQAAAQPGQNLRSAQRFPIAIPVPVVPIGADGVPVERPFTAVSRDISTSGICLQYTRPTNAKQLVIVLNVPGTKPTRLLVEVVRCRAIGRFYEIAAKFSSRVTDASKNGGAESAAE
ncbi:MAG: PilZ domain-containing protein [Planctomycetaceae bacterium]